MAINTDTLNTIVEMVKKFFQDLIKPDMTIEKLAEVASPQLDNIIKKNAEKGLNYANGKFKIRYLNDEHFALEFEMYFKDEAGKWYKAANESEPRKAELMEPSAWKTLKALKVVEFPIGAPKTEEAAKVKPPVESQEPSDNTIPKESKESSSNEITLEKLMDGKKTAN